MKMQTIEDFARVIELARVVYQVETDATQGRSLVDPDHLRVDVCPPGVCGLDDPDGEPTPKTWRLTIGEENNGGLARGEGATLTEACEALAREVEGRRRDVLDAIREAEATR